MSLRKCVYLSTMLVVAACAGQSSEAQLVGRYQLVNGPAIRLEINHNGAGRISNGADAAKISWSLEDGQVFLDLPSRFLSQLDSLGLSRQQKAQGQVPGVRGYFGLMPDCRAFKSCRLKIDLDGGIYFKRLD